MDKNNPTRKDLTIMTTKDILTLRASAMAEYEYYLRAEHPQYSRETCEREECQGLLLRIKRELESRGIYNV